MILACQQQYSLHYIEAAPNPEYLVPGWLKLENKTLLGTAPANNHQAIVVQLQGEDGFGGKAYRLVSMTIPNSAPVINRELGVITAFAGELKMYIVSRDAIQDVDGDDLSFAAMQRDQTPLPDWAIHFHLVGYKPSPLGGNVFSKPITSQNVMY